MKKLAILLVLAFCVSSLFSQQLFFEAYSGYNLTNYDLEPYSEEAKGYIPIGFKIAGGHQYVQAGFDYRQHITNPKFEVVGDPAILRHEFEETYYGAFLRGNVSSLPAYRFGLILSAGAGYYKPTLKSYLVDGDDVLAEVKYDKKLGYNFYVGVSAPIFAQLHWEIGYQYNAVTRPETEQLLGAKIPEYAANYHCIHVGLSGNFVFGNTEKACRRVMSSSRKR